MRVCSDDPRTLENALRTTEEVWAGEYDHAELPREVGTILDIGAGWGAFSVWARQKWPTAYIVGYEPHAAAARIYERNCPWAWLVEAAVTTQAAPRFYVDCYWSGGHTHEVSEGVAVTPLHPRELPACDVLKADCEGTEVEILAEYPHLAGCRAVLYEFHTPILRDECRAIVERRAPRLRCLHEEKTRGYGVSLWAI